MKSRLDFLSLSCSDPESLLLVTSSRSTCSSSVMYLCSQSLWRKKGTWRKIAERYSKGLAFLLMEHPELT